MTSYKCVDRVFWYTTAVVVDKKAVLTRKTSIHTHDKVIVNDK
jgi:hypothetical protein